MKRIVFIVASAAFAVSCTALADGSLIGGPFSIIGTVTSAGGRSSGSAIASFGGIVSVAGTSSGGNFILTSGVLDFSATEIADFGLDILLGGSRQIQLSWPAEAVGYTLEFSPSVGPAANWQSVTPAPTANSYSLQADQNPRFFRLRR